MSITVLPKELSELIAAGEVIERPASVIKELVENSIDAGASRITVEIRNGGSVYMRITDDGCGIAPEEVPTAFLRHATSKILEKADLDNIHTLGFRGEALASVAAVGRVEMLTKQAGAEYGVRYQIEGGTECGMERTGCPEGTTIVIRDLFFNVPARQKFLKKDVTESNAVSAIVQKIALSHPEIAFTLIRDHRREFHAAGDGTLYSAIYAVYGRSFAQDLLPVSYSENGVSLEGYVIKPLYAKNNRSLQTFFINGRYVKSVTCSVALEEAYRTLVMTGKFPACVLMLTVPPETVDVNVHPAKAAVRFTDEKRVSSAVFFAVKNALMQNGLIYEFQMRPTADWQHAPKEQEPGFVDAPLPPVPPLESVQPAKPAPMPAHQEAPVPVAAVKPMPVGNVQVTVHAPEPEEALYMHSPKLEYGAAPAAPKPIQEPDPLPETSAVFAGFDLLQDTAAAKQEEPVQAPVPAPEEQPKIRVIGEAFTNYILAQAGDSLYIIDKHAAHERVLFEQFRDASRTPDSQMILNSSELLLSVAEFDALQANQEALKQRGFAFDFSNPPYVAVCAVPVVCASLNLDELVLELAENLALGKQDLASTQLEDALHTMACKAAIRAGDKNDLSELQALAEEVFGNERIRHCPHGRPVLFELTRHEIEKQFKRV